MGNIPAYANFDLSPNPYISAHTWHDPIPDATWRNYKSAVILLHKQGFTYKNFGTLDEVVRTAPLEKFASHSDHVIEYAGNGVKDVKRAHAAACRNAGIEDFTIHDLRHTATVWMCGKNVRMEKISTYLGHTNVNITYSTYAKYQPDHLRDAAEAVEI